MVFVQSAPAMECAVCPVCGGAGEEQFRQRDYFCGGEGEFGQRRCGRCSVYFLSPRPTEESIDAYYPRTYAPYLQAKRGAVDRAAEAIGLPFVRRRIVQRFVKGGRILDVGCGNGSFLETMSNGWERYAMDIQQHGEFPFPFLEGRIDHGKPPIGELDAITLWHVFEHLYHPERALRNLKAMLKPGGYLFLAIPDLDCLERRLFGRYWVGWDPPRHVATYSRTGMDELLRRAGFRLVDVVPDYCNGHMFALNLEFVLRARGVWRNLQDSLALRAMFTPWPMIASRIGLAPAKVYVARN